MASSIVPPPGGRAAAVTSTTSAPISLLSREANLAMRLQDVSESLQKHSCKVAATTSSTTARGFQWAREALGHQPSLIG